MAVCPYCLHETLPEHPWHEKSDCGDCAVNRKNQNGLDETIRHLTKTLASALDRVRGLEAEVNRLRKKQREEE